MLSINVVNKSKHALPEYSTANAAGMDVKANLDSNVVLEPGHRVLIPTGLFFELPIGFEAQVRPRSGLAIKKGITVLNSPGTIDADYRGEVGIILLNTSSEDFIIEDGERICQLVFAPCEQASLVLVQKLSETVRGSGGFGHTGEK